MTRRTVDNDPLANSTNNMVLVLASTNSDSRYYCSTVSLIGCTDWSSAFTTPRNQEIRAKADASSHVIDWQRRYQRNVHPKDKDTRSDPEHKKGTKRWVPTPCSVTMLCNPTDLWQQEHVAMMKHAHRVSNLANGDVNLVGTFDKTWKCFCCSATLITVQKSRLLPWWNIGVGKFLFKALSLHFVPCLWSIWRWRIIVYQSCLNGSCPMMLLAQCANVILKLMRTCQHGWSPQSWGAGTTSSLEKRCDCHSLRQLAEAQTVTG